MNSGWKISGKADPISIKREKRYGNVMEFLPIPPNDNSKPIEQIGKAIDKVISLTVCYFVFLMYSELSSP